VAKGEVSGSSDFEQMADKYSASSFAIALAWLMHFSPTAIPIPGATRIESVVARAKSTEIELSQQDFEYLRQNLPTEIPVFDELTPKPQYR
jgi:aryl-alcohol dehydrogenase-like predicted oxidoreductase